MKWLAITVIIILAIVLAGGGYFLWQYITELDEAEAEIVTLEGNVSSLEGDVSTLEGDVAVLEKELADSEAEVSTLEADLSEAQSQISSLQSDLTAAQAKVNELEDFKWELGSLWDSLKPKLTLGAAILNFWNGAAQVVAGEKTELEYEVESTSFLVTGTVQTEVIGNDELTGLWDDFVSYAEQEKETEMFSSFAALTDLLMDLIDQDIVAIEAQLSE